MEETSSVRLADLPLDQIRDPELQIRMMFDDEKMDELQESMRKIGLVQPIVVVIKEGGYEVVAGHRRLICARWLKWNTIRAIIMPKVFEYGEVFKVHENLMREDVHPIDEANFLHELMARLSINQSELAKLIFKSEAYVSERLAMKEWPPDVVKSLADNEIVYSTAREFAKITDEPVRREYIRFATDGGCTPAVAKKWREGWERDKLERESPRGEPDPPDALKAPDPIYMPCYVCRMPHDITKTVMIRVCEKCVDDVFKKEA